MDCNFRDLPDFQSSEARLMTASRSTCANTYQHSSSYKEISVPMTCLDCKYLLGNTRITEHNTRSIYGRPKSTVPFFWGATRYNGATRRLNIWKIQFLDLYPVGCLKFRFIILFCALRYPTSISPDT